MATRTMTQPTTTVSPITLPPVRIGTVFMAPKAGKRPAERHTLAEVEYDRLKSTTPADKYGVHTFITWWTYEEFQQATNGRVLTPELFAILTTPPTAIMPIIEPESPF